MICIGGSHTNAIAAAAEDAGEGVCVINLRSFQTPFVQKHKSLQLHPDVTRAIGVHRGPAFSIVGGNRHNRLGLVRHPRPFDFVLPEQPDLPLDPAAELIPYNAIKAALTLQSQSIFQQLQALSDRYNGQLTQIESPPPATEAEIRERPGKAREQIGEHGAGYAMTRYRLWRLYSTIIRSFCDRLGVRFLTVPPESMDQHGFLLPHLTKNATHGNRLYGAMVLARMKAGAG